MLMGEVGADFDHPEFTQPPEGKDWYYGELRDAALTDQGLFDAMVSRYPDWVSR